MIKDLNMQYVCSNTRIALILLICWFIVLWL